MLKMRKRSVSFKMQVYDFNIFNQNISSQLPPPAKFKIFQVKFCFCVKTVLQHPLLDGCHIENSHSLILAFEKFDFSPNDKHSFIKMLLSILINFEESNHLQKKTIPAYQTPGKSTQI